VVWIAKSHPNGHAAETDTALSSQSKRPRGLFYPTQTQWATLSVEPVQQRVFAPSTSPKARSRSTRIVRRRSSPLCRRVTKLFVKPGDTVTVGQPLFTVEAADMVQAQNDFISA